MKDCFDLTGRVAVVTRASSGLGAQFARALAYRGTDVVLLARRKEKLETVAEEIRAFEHTALPIPCDMTENAQVEAAVKKTIGAFGKIDILVNNAGTCKVVPTVELTPAQWKKTMDINLEAVVFMTKYVASYMMEKKYGRIKNRKT